MSTALATVSAPSLPAAVVRLPVSLQPAAVAMLAEQSPARAYPLAVLAAEVGKLITAAAGTIGLSRTADHGVDLLTLGNTTTGMIQAAFGWLKPAEITIAFERGARGDYALPLDRDGRPAFEAFGVPMFRRWLSAYCEKARWDAARALEAANEKPAAAPLPDDHPEVIQWRVDVVAGLIANPERLEAPVAAGGVGAPVAGLVYDWLVKWKLLTRSFRPPDVYREWMDDAREAIINRPRPAEREAARKFRAYVEAIADTGAPPVGHSLEEEARQMCRMRTLREWLSDYSDLGLEAVKGMLTDAANDYYAPSDHGWPLQ